MTKWTETASAHFDEYCRRVRKSLADDKSDADEVIDDLRRHIDEEANAAGLTVLDRETLIRLLAKFGAPEYDDQAENRPAAPVESRPKKVRSGPGVPTMVFGVVLPAVTILFELATGMSAGTLFDPLPTWFHVLLVSLVPLTNGILWETARSDRKRDLRLLGWLNAAAIGLCLIYALLFLPFVPFASIAVIYFGIGLIPLAPVLALPTTIILRMRLRQSAGVAELPGFAGGFALGIAALVALNAQTFLTYRGLALATDEDAATRAHGVKLLRSFGDEDQMLRACYGFIRGVGALDLMRYTATGDRHVSTDQARQIFYRVTGTAFNAHRPPKLYNRSGRWDGIDRQFSWDSALGGDAVAQRVRGLSIISSRLDAVAESDAGTTYTEWTMEFKNVDSRQREARAQIALPPGGVVSRLTLWIDGEEREAAFAGRSAVREAYRQVAVVRRRDPVLVTTAGPDRILMQCFPVPPNGGTMKIRIGVTAPLALDSADQGRHIWPRFLERNFRMPDEFEHSLWIDSTGEISGAMGTKVDGRDDCESWQTKASETQLAAGATTLSISRNPAVSVWTPALKEGTFVVQNLTESTATEPAKIVFVIDGSVGMNPHVDSILAGLKTLDPQTPFAVTLGMESGILDSGSNSTSPISLDTFIKSHKFVGGHDNIPALIDAWTSAASSPGSVVVWIHAPQAVQLESPDTFRQLIERSDGRIPIYEFQVSNGPDRVVEAMDGLPNIHHTPRTEDVRSDLESLLKTIVGQQAVLRWKRILTTETPSGLKTGSRHIERLWAKDEITALLKQRRTADAVALAAEQQLVTPCSGAVVLENQQQYDENNLNPVDAQSVPSIPEPSTILLLIVGVGGLLVRARSMRARRRSRYIERVGEASAIQEL